MIAENEEHVAVVRSGTAAISAWRRDHPDVPLVLSYAELDGLDLRNADLSHCRLYESSLRSSKLTGASLEGSDILEADFSDSDLTGSNLALCSICGMNLSGASMNGSDLAHSAVTAHLLNCSLQNLDLSWTRFTNVEMTNVDLTGSYCSHTVFANVDLSGARGLDTLRIDAPCSVGIDTVFRSRGLIPRGFLEKCGIPRAAIESMLALLPTCLDYESVFISHSSNDRDFCSHLLSRLRELDVRAWYSPSDMRGGRRTLDQVMAAISSHDRCVLVLSESSMNSEWVKSELRAAARRENEAGRSVLFPIRLTSMDRIRSWTCFDADSGRDLAALVRSYHILDFSGWHDPSEFNASVCSLVDALRRGNLPTIPANPRPRDAKATPPDK